MDNPRISGRLRAMMDAHNTALAALLRASDHMGAAIVSMGQAQEQQRIAIEAALMANEAAVAVLDAWDEGHRGK